MARSAHCEVVVIGAGPYGLSLAAHLRCFGTDFRIFGTPMHRWRTQMPKGMFLKSEGCASSLSDPAGRFTLAQFCAEESLCYGDYGVPVPLETFTRYGLGFQQHLVPGVEDVLVTTLDARSHGFEMTLSNGETVTAGKVVVATGLSHTAHIPPELVQLPAERLSHSGDHNDLSSFKGRQVVVIGAGQSALETAALLREAGASPHLIVRQPALAWNLVPVIKRRSLYQRLRRPMSNLGAGLGVWVYDNAPLLFHGLPLRTRTHIVRTTLGPAGGWWLKDRVVGRLPILLGHSVRDAQVRGDHVQLQLQGQNGDNIELRADHVIAATGYRFALRSLPFLSQRLLSRLSWAHPRPRLSRNFESAMPGLYFVGQASADSFGPVMRFVTGADYTARRVSGHIATAGRRGTRPVVGIVGAPKCKDFRAGS
jgi:FAD-dependent urate hydroxylase